MSRRKRSAQQLASLLTRKSGALVRVYYDSDIRLHRVVWANGPDVAQMYTLALRWASTLPELDLATLQWDRDTSNGSKRPVPSTVAAAQS
jgi:hypothetical protein